MNENIIRQFELLIKHKKRELYNAPPEQEFHKSISISQTKKALEEIKKYSTEIKHDDLNKLLLIKGIGKKTINRIKEIINTGKLNEIHKYDKQNKLTDIEIKEIHNLSKVINIGEKFAKKLIKQHDIHSVEQLINTLKNNKIQLNDKILLGLKYHKKYKQNVPRKEIINIETILMENIKIVDLELFGVICGSYRRQKMISNDIDLLITHPNIKTKKQFENMNTNNNYLRLLVDKLKDIGFIIDSAPPANMTSASPCFMSSQAVPIASEPLEQADVVQRFGPLTPSAIDIWAAAISAIIIGARKGLTLSGPFSSSTLTCSNRVVSPPIPLPTMTPILS